MVGEQMHPSVPPLSVSQRRERGDGLNVSAIGYVAKSAGGTPDRIIRTGFAANAGTSVAEPPYSRLLSGVPSPTLRPMSRERKIFRRSALLSFRFLFTAVLGSVLMGLVAAFGPLSAQLAMLGCFISILGGLFLAYLGQEDGRENRRAEMIERLAVPLTLAPEHDLYAQYLAFCRTLTALAGQADPILREIAGLKLASVVGQLDLLASGTALFSGTEGWRTVYEKILASPDLREYRSVAWVRATDYWQDAPGRQSMRANFEAVQRGLLIERIVILRDDLWPSGTPLPTLDIRPWIEEQHNHGIWVLLVRQNDLASEMDLLADIGIYGGRAIGTQELDDRSRTLRFTLTFDPQVVRLARDRWERLYLFATPYQTLLDRAPPRA